PKGVFSPGHDKWDYEYSLGERHADLVVEAVDVTPADEAFIASLGFETLPNGMRLRRDAAVTERNREVLGRERPRCAPVAAALGEVAETSPPPRAADYAMVLAFALVIAFAVRSAARDGESFAELSPEAPEEDDAPDPDADAALAGADAKSIP